MNIDFFASLEDDYTIKLYDLSDINYSLPQEVNSMTIDIISSKIPNGQIPNRLDVISYLRTEREQREIYTIKSETLGFASTQIIPDGVYHMQYNINNVYSKEYSFLVFNTVDKAVKELITNVNYNIEIGDYDISYVGDSSEYDIEKVRLAITLRDSLIEQTQNPDEVAVNDTLDKLTRLLEIISEDV